MTGRGKMALAALLALAGASAAAAPPSHPLHIVNDTNQDANQVFAVQARGHDGVLGKVGKVFRTPADEVDRLGAKTLSAGGAVTVTLEGAACRYDLSAVLLDGRTFVARDHDVCADPEWRIASASVQP